MMEYYIAISPRALAAGDQKELNLTVLGRGTFGEITYRQGERVVYKTALHYDTGDQVLREFEVYKVASVAAGRSHLAGAFFVPDVYQYWQPATSSTESRKLFHPRGVTLRGIHEPISEAFLRPTMQLELIPMLPACLADAYRKIFFSLPLRLQCPPVRLLRLYFGREELPDVTNEKQPKVQSDFPLNIHRYELLRTKVEGKIVLPSVAEISFGMGELLARLHWVAGINCRDIELVLGGSGDGGVRCWALDYNQCQRWLELDALKRAVPMIFDMNNKIHTESLTADHYAGKSFDEGCIRLARLVQSQELYYPRPHQTEAYEPFKLGYEKATQMIKSGLHGQRAHILCQHIDQAVRAFFIEYEKLDAAKQLRSKRPKMALKYADG